MRFGRELCITISIHRKIGQAYVSKMKAPISFHQNDRAVSKANFLQAKIDIQIGVNPTLSTRGGIQRVTKFEEAPLATAEEDEDSTMNSNKFQNSSCIMKFYQQMPEKPERAKYGKKEEPPERGDEERKARETAWGKATTGAV